MKNLKYSLGRIGNVVLFQIHEQTPLFRSTKDDGGILFEASNGIWVKSADHPAIYTSQAIYIGGDEPTLDNEVATMVFDSGPGAEKFVKDVEAALKEWSAYVDTLAKPASPVTPATGPSIVGLPGIETREI